MNRSRFSFGENRPNFKREYLSGLYFIADRHRVPREDIEREWERVNALRKKKIEELGLTPRMVEGAWVAEGGTDVQRNRISSLSSRAFDGAEGRLIKLWSRQHGLDPRLLRLEAWVGDDVVRRGGDRSTAANLVDWLAGQKKKTLFLESSVKLAAEHHCVFRLVDAAKVMPIHMKAIGNLAALHCLTCHVHRPASLSKQHTYGKEELEELVSLLESRRVGMPLVRSAVRAGIVLRPKEFVVLDNVIDKSRRWWKRGELKEKPSLDQALEYLSTGVEPGELGVMHDYAHHFDVPSAAFLVKKGIPLDFSRELAREIEFEDGSRKKLSADEIADLYSQRNVGDDSLRFFLLAGHSPASREFKLLSETQRLAPHASPSQVLTALGSSNWRPRQAVKLIPLPEQSANTVYRAAPQTFVSPLERTAKIKTRGVAAPQEAHEEEQAPSTWQATPLVRVADVPKNWKMHDYLAVLSNLGFESVGGVHTGHPLNFVKIVDGRRIKLELSSKPNHVVFARAMQKIRVTQEEFKKAIK